MRQFNHSAICLILLTIALSRVKNQKKYSNILYAISAIYALIYLIAYGTIFSTFTNSLLDFFYFILYILIIGFFIYTTFVFLNKKDKNQIKFKS